MNIKKIKKIINNDYMDNEVKEELILKVIANSKTAIPRIMEMLSYERHIKESLITDLNLLLSKTSAIIENPLLNHGNFIQKEITEFYNNNEICNNFKKGELK